MLAPILVFTYTRVSHFILTIESLKKADLAKDSILVVISDGPKDKFAYEYVSEIRDYAKKIDGFLSVELLFRESNWGVIKSFKEAKTQYLNRFGKIICMEDDNIVHPRLLTFLNDSLDYFENDERVFSISGYSIPVNFDSKSSFYFLPWFVPWVFATWKNKYLLFDWETNLFSEINAVKNNRSKMKKYGDFFYESAYLDHKGYSHAIDARLNMHLFNNQMVTVCPMRSLVKNIGNDGTGVNAGITERFNTDLNFHCEQPFNFYHFDNLDSNILKAQRKFMDRGFVYRVVNFLYLRRMYYITAYYFPSIKKIINNRFFKIT